MGSMYDTIKTGIQDTLAPIKASLGWEDTSGSSDLPSATGGSIIDASRTVGLSDQPYVRVYDKDAQGNDIVSTGQNYNFTRGMKYQDMTPAEQEEYDRYIKDKAMARVGSDTSIVDENGKLMEEAPLIELDGQSQFKQGIKDNEESDWKEWIPNMLPKLTPPKAVKHQRGLGGRGYTGGDSTYYNYTGTFENMADPLNSQLTSRMANKQKQLLGLGK